MSAGRQHSHRALGVVVHVHDDSLSLAKPGRGRRRCWSCRHGFRWGLWVVVVGCRDKRGDRAGSPEPQRRREPTERLSSRALGLNATSQAARLASLLSDKQYPLRDPSSNERDKGTYHSKILTRRPFCSTRPAPPPAQACPPSLILAHTISAFLARCRARLGRCLSGPLARLERLAIPVETDVVGIVEDRPELDGALLIPELSGRAVHYVVVLELAVKIRYVSDRNMEDVTDEETQPGTHTRDEAGRSR